MKIEPTNWFTTKLSDYLVEITPRCKDITRLLSSAQDKKLPLRQRIMIKLHFAICEWCERYGEHLGLLRRWSRETPEHVHDMRGTKLSPEARERMKHALRENG